MGKITILARMGIKPQNVEKAKALAMQGCKVAVNEPGTLAYDWHYSADVGSLIVLESYADSEAHLTHMGAAGHAEFMGALMALIDSIEFFVLGEPTPEHRAALSRVPGAQFYSEVASLHFGGDRRNVAGR